MTSRRYIWFVILVVCSASSLEAQRVEYNRDIRPILSENCFFCHGFDEESRESGLRLDTFAGATESSIVPGEPDESELLRRIVSQDADEIMPPPETEKQLTKEQIELVRQWIKQGAEYQEHWAWKPLERPDVDSKSGNAIDAFLQEGWRENNTAPVGRATPREQLRRLSLDLRGVPPSYEDVVLYQQDPTTKRFVQFRDQWMSELAYAEHQAVRWLDLVRWADTSGFVSDEPIASGAYRAWIIRSIRDNMPFDKFSIAQLAGDLLPNPTDDDYIASGYNRIVNTNCEAGGIEEEQLYKLKGEHVRAVGTVWLGLTTGCAECHDHKFDPFSAKDYYSLAAFFDDLVEAGVYTPGDRREPLHYVYADDSQSRADANSSRRIDDLTGRLNKEFASLTADQRKEIEAELIAKLKDKKTRGEFVWIPGQIPGARIVEGAFDIRSREEKVVRESSAMPKTLHRHHVAELMTGFFNFKPNKDNETDAVYVDVWIDKENRPDLLGFQFSNGRYGRIGWKTASYETYYWGDDTSGTLEKTQPWSTPKRVKRIGDLPKKSGWVRLRVPYSQLITPTSGSYEKTGVAWIHVGGRVQWGDSGFELPTDQVTRMRLAETGVRKWWERPYNRQFYQSRVDIVSKALRASAANRNELQKELVLDAVREAALPALVDQLRREESRIALARRYAMPVLVSRVAANHKVTRLLHRGDYQDKTGPVMSPALPEFLEETTASDGKLSRLDLAQWMFSQDNPIVARVFVNRLWHQFYGRGISETLEDAGTQGDWPSHVTLLDWLAFEFRNSGWDRNHMVRLLTSADAYRLSSTPTENLAERDPANRWHARQGRFRMTAESIRDTTLGAAGLLETTTEIPMESIFPYQPSPYWARSDKVMYGSRHLVWATSPKRSQYRRSLYTFWKRQNIHPTMLAFDAPTRQECTAKRNITNTPGQALALLNDPIFVEAARVMAMRLCESDSSSDEQKIESAFAKTLQRKPSSDETNLLTQLLSSQRTEYASDPDAAKRLVSIGQSPPPSDEDIHEVAAWTVVTRTILNLHEFLNRQ